MTHDFSSLPVDRDEGKDLAVAQAKAFDAFDRWMDIQLEKLVARWIHAAAPNASRPRSRARGARSTD